MNSIQKILIKDGPLLMKSLQKYKLGKRNMKLISRLG